MLKSATNQESIEDMKEDLDIANINGHLLLYLVNDILDYSLQISEQKLKVSISHFNLKDCLKEL